MVSLDLVAVAAAVYLLDDVAARSQVSADAVGAALADLRLAVLARKLPLYILKKYHSFLEKYC